MDVAPLALRLAFALHRTLALPGRRALRIALLALIEPGGSELPLPRASLRVGGASIARHQLALALALECQRVLCLTRNATSDVAELRQAAGAAHMDFQVVPSPMALVAQVTANDEVIVIGDGLLTSGAAARAALAERSGVIVQPVERGLPAGFERIDLNHASAGLMRIPGRLIERLAELPADCDIVSALTRIALQAGVPMREMPVHARDGIGWRLIRNEDDAHVAEDALIAQQTAGLRTPVPAVWLARAGVTVFGPSLLQGGHGSTTLFLGFFMALALALGAGWLDLTATALVICVFGWIVLDAAATLQRIEQATLRRPLFPALREPWLGWLFDATLVMLIVWRAPLLPWESVMGRVFPPLMLIGLFRLLPLLLPRDWEPWLRDRAMLSAVLAALAALDALAVGVPVLALALITLGLALGRGSSPITRD